MMYGVLLTCVLALRSFVIADVTLCRATELGSPSGLPDQDVLLQIVQNGGLTRRHESSYLKSDGEVVGDCASGSPYSIRAGRLYTNGAFHSAPQGVRSAKFFASRQGLGVDTVFAVADGILYWDNKAFEDGSARFATSPQNKIEAMFQGPLPFGYTSIAIRTVPASSCPRIGSSLVAPGLAAPTFVAASTEEVTQSPNPFGEATSLTSKAHNSSGVSSSVVVSLGGSVVPSASASSSDFAMSATFTSARSSKTSTGTSGVSISSYKASSSASKPPFTISGIGVQSANSTRPAVASTSAAFRSFLETPIPLAGDTVSASEDIDSASFEVPLRFVVELYGQPADTLWVSTDGVISFNHPPGCSDSTNDTSYANAALPGLKYSNVSCSAEGRVSVLPPYSICPLWYDMSIGKGQPQGIWYEYTREGLIIEFRLQSSRDPSKRYHFLWFYLYKQPGMFTVHYVDTTDQGANATVGVKGAYGIYLQYSFDEAVVADGLVLAIDTNRNNFTASNGFKPLTFSEFPMASE